MKKLVALLLALCMVFALCAVSASAEWPTDGEINVLIPAKTGGDTDTTFRTFSTDIGEQLGTNVMLTNMPGGAGATATYELLDYDADGYTGLWHHYDSIILTMLGKVDERYDEYLDIACVVPVVGGEHCVIVRQDSQWNTLEEFVAYGKEHPGEIIWAIEAGGWSQMFAMAVADKLGIEVNFVDFGSASDRNAALLGGNCDVLLAGPTYIVDTYPDDFKGLASCSPERQETIPDIPTCKELGYDIIGEKFYFFGFKKGTDEKIVEEMGNAIEHAIASDAGVEVLGEKYHYTDWSVLKGDEAYDYLKAFEVKYAEAAEKMMG